MRPQRIGNFRNFKAFTGGAKINEDTSYFKELMSNEKMSLSASVDYKDIFKKMISLIENLKINSNLNKRIFLNNFDETILTIKSDTSTKKYINANIFMYGIIIYRYAIQHNLTNLGCIKYNINMALNAYFNFFINHI